MNDLIPTISSLRKALSDLDQAHAQELVALSENLAAAKEFEIYFERLWVGGWARNDFNHYQNPNSQHQTIQVEADYFYEYIAKKAGVDVVALGSRITEITAGFRKFQKHLVTELSVIRDVEKFNNEVGILDKIGDFRWGFDSNTFIKTRIPNHMPVYDLGILSRGGLSVPSHIQVWGYLSSLQTQAVAPRNFNDMVVQLLRQLELKSPQRSGARTDYTEKILADIFENFHPFCTQLRNRHNSRAAFDLTDEYDVQDLIHAILRLHFKDVREEEYTPSYAGSSTRVDFLLKNEQIVIEVKKTRQGLADKQVGEQLILDAVHYANHPNCKGLICFVYDPESRIKNPRGLEEDIRKLSNDSMPVELFIRP
ncbi:PD-(D/E)XK nuclease domain-containing protein [Mucilaginibacter paludis]|uniref:Uncharacterized protein n=1 Tax=Mucilaginibacter paludis DSM 18603 TaxID=714943 RepID=H1Y182_9SPHI|nr:hypothetical protein [Mucilaginibacter paludis]EHQ29717.1 hypothetical protein Mucpa_5648 [Mucilaginibacter paludis DSM 18603]